MKILDRDSRARMIPLGIRMRVTVPCIRASDNGSGEVSPMLFCARIRRRSSLKESGCENVELRES